MTNYFLMSLGVADLLVCMVVMPFGAIVTFQGKIFGAIVTFQGKIFRAIITFQGKSNCLFVIE